MIKNGKVLLPVNGFYEWQRESRKPVPAFHMTPAKGSAMFMADISKPSADENDLFVD